MGGEDDNSTNSLGSILSEHVQSQLLGSASNGVFLDSCSHHCGSQGPHPAWGPASAPGSKIDGVLMGEAVKDWYEQGSQQLKNKGFYNQNQEAPCESCCHSDVADKGCPAAFPWAYRPSHNFDFCCASADDNAGNVGVNARVDRSTRSNTCKDNKAVRCMSPPCQDYQSPSVCPATHPFAYRPAANFDFCCASADDNAGHAGINSSPDRMSRSNSCKDNDYFRCGVPPCADYPHEHFLV